MKTLHFAIPEHFRLLLEQAALTKTFRAGALLFRRGDPVQGVYLVRTGEIALSLADVPEPPARMVGPGALLGLPATIGGRPYSLSAEVIEPAEVGFIPREEFMKLLRQNFDLCLAVIQGLASELTETRRQASQLLEQQFHGVLTRET